MNVGRGASDFSSMTKPQLITRITFLENRKESMKGILEECEQNLRLARQSLQRLQQDDSNAKSADTTSVSTESMPSLDERKAEPQTDSEITYEKTLSNCLTAIN